MPHPRTTADIEWIHRKLMEMLHVISDVAGGLDERFYLAYGTALGACRDQDLIRWDIDADLWVPSPGYGALCVALRARLPRDLTLKMPGDAGYEYLFARIALAGVDHKIVHLDLFPLIGIPASKRWAALLRVSLRLLCQAHLVKVVRISEKHHYGVLRRIVTSILKVMLLWVRADSIRRLFDRLVELSERHSGSGRLLNPCGAYGRRENFRAQWFATGRRVHLRDMDLPVPDGIDELLRQIYGDYSVPIDEAHRDREFAKIEDYFLAALRSSGTLPDS